MGTYRDRGSSRPRQAEAAVSRPTLHDNWSCTRLQSSGRPSAKGAGSGSRTFGTATISRGEVPSIGAIGRRPDGDRTPFGCLSGRATAPWTDPGSHPKLGLARLAVPQPIPLGVSRGIERRGRSNSRRVDQPAMRRATTMRSSAPLGRLVLSVRYRFSAGCEPGCDRRDRDGEILTRAGRPARAARGPATFPCPRPTVPKRKSHSG